MEAERLDPNLAALEDEELFLRCREAEGPELCREAVSVLATRHAEALCRYLYGFVRSRETAEDLAQEAFIRIYKHARGYKEVARVRTWLFRIGTNLALNAIRDRRRRPAVSLEAIGPEGGPGEAADPGAPDPARAAESAELRRRVRDAIEQLPEHYRAVVLLCDLEGFSYQEAADVLETKLGTIRSRLFRGRAELHKIMAPLLQGDAGC